MGAMSAAESVRGVSRWTTRTIPIALAGAVGYATYVTVVRVCVDYLINSQGDVGAAIAILVLYFVFLLLVVVSYLRTIIQINTDAGLLPLGPMAVERRVKEAQTKGKSNNDGDIESQRYYIGPDNNPDSPGLEQFYTKDVFVCEGDGRPKWCSECCNWKLDRIHHSSEINRCVIRMDHYCPWVGGMVGENSFKFFTQLTMYTAFYCGIVLGAVGSTLAKQLSVDLPVDGHLIGAIALGGFFGLFTFLMTVTSWRYVAENMTNVDMLGHSSKVYQLAVIIPRGNPYSERYHTITYPLPKPGQTVTSHLNDRVERGQVADNDILNQPSQGQTARDTHATRTFAIVKTDPGENPWDLGYWENWKDIMGTSVVDWFLPIRRSPCTNHDSQESYYRMGHVLDKIRSRYGLTGTTANETDRIEMRELAGNPEGI